MSHHLPDATKMISDTPRMKAAQMAAMEHMTGDVYRVGCDIEQQLNAANVEIDEKRKDIVYLATEKAKLEERINRLEEMYEKEIGENDKFIGTNLQALLTRELNAANERIKQLEKALEATAMIIGPPGHSEWATDDEINHAWGLYIQTKEAKL